MANWERIGREFRETLQAKIPPQWRLPENQKKDLPRNILSVFGDSGLLTSKDIEITDTEDATTLLRRIHAGELTAVEVTTAFCKRAAIAHQLVNCLMDIDFDGAIARAEELDKHFASTGTLVGPLHGLPISLKDLTKAKGFHHSFGITSWAGREDDEDAVLVQALRQAGAIFYVKTTMPQTGMALETVSNLWGRTLNPYNVSLSAGGSSGGEAALGACHGAPIGISTDIGGSIRAPAAFNGLYGIRPTSKRFSYAGNVVTTGGQIAISATAGPVGRSIRDLELICRILNEAKPWDQDPAVVPKPWASIPPAKKAVIGVMQWDEVVMPHPPILRATKIVVEELRRAGHEVVEFEPYRHKHAWDITLPIYFPTGAQELKQFIADTGEPMIPSAAKMLESVKSLSAQELMYYHREQRAYQLEFLKHWNATANQTSHGEPIDALLMPSFPSASFPHDFLPWWGYLSTWNLLDYPAVIIPVTHVVQADVQDPKYNPVNELDAENYKLYDPALFEGVPVSLQLVGRPYQEEQLLATAGAIDALVKKRAG